MHIYLCQIDPLQLSIDLYKTITPHKFPPLPIKHRSLQNHYTKYVSHIGQCTDKLKVDGPPWSIEHRCLEYHYTKLVSIVNADIDRSSGRSTLPPRSASSYEWSFPISILKAHICR